MSAPLAGIRVLDFSRVLAGPYCSMFLADMGADVVKVERPGLGDDTRQFGPPFSQGMSTYYLSINRGKRSIELDLKSEEGRSTAISLAARADVVIENFRPGVMERLGLGPEVLRKDNARLIYACISGFGRHEARAGYDLVIQGMGGVTSITGDPDGEPAKCGASIADLVTGLNAVQGILAGLYRRERTGEGGLVDVPMIDGQVSLLTYHASGLLNAGVHPQRLGNHHPSIHPYGSYQASDGHMNIAVGSEAIWSKFCRVMQQGTWENDPRFEKNAARVEHRAELDPLIEAVLIDASVMEWCDRFAAGGVPAGPINDISKAVTLVDLVEHPHPGGDGMLRTAPLPWALEDAPRAATLPPPRLGQHSTEVLQDWLENDVNSD